MEEIIACELTQWAFLVKAFCVCVSIIPSELPISPAPRSPPGAGFYYGTDLYNGPIQFCP